MRLLQAATLVLLGTGLARAEDDLSRFRPMPRPVATEGQLADQPSPLIRPPPRPVTDEATEAPAVHPLPRPDVLAADDSLARFRPKPRPNLPKVQPVIAAPVVQPMVVAPALKPTVQPVIAAPKGKPEKPVKGALCQRADLVGNTMAPIRSSNPGCKVPDAIKLSQVAGVKLNPPATVNCEEAQALSTWVKNGLQPAFNNSIVALNVVDSYSCRPRNNVRGAQTSVHGLGQAIDIAGFVTNTGKTYTVAQNYNAQIKAAQKAGCGTFHTILGPGSDGYHENHIHFDVAHHRGDYCH